MPLFRRYHLIASTCLDAGSVCLIDFGGTLQAVAVLQCAETIPARKRTTCMLLSDLFAHRKKTGRTNKVSKTAAKKKNW
jgi:hypothetical protein